MADQQTNRSEYGSDKAQRDEEEELCTQQYEDYELECVREACECYQLVIIVTQLTNQAMQQTPFAHHSNQAAVQQEARQTADMPEVFWGPKEHQVAVCLQKEIGAVFQKLIERINYSDIAFQVHDLFQSITLHRPEGIDDQHNMVMDQIQMILEQDLLNPPRNKLGNRNAS